MAATCLNCGNENREGRKFCARCGAALAFACPSCGAANEAADRFCGECGAALDVATTAELPAAPVAERKLVSVLFIDLVGFTQLSEARDAEDVRDLLTRYFETAHTVIERYGGTVEKFIGDAVMAVWGAPVTREDDAERAVRAALDLTVAVAALGDDVSIPTLAARAGIATGEAAVTLGARDQGMVAGDLVNTAARVQSAASPGSVLATDATMRASEAAVVYEDAGTHALKGKAEALHLWRAERVVAGRGGSLRSTGLESPFVGRERELRVIKDLFHASADDARAHLVAVTGIAGIGKSRMSWEFFKYMDGLVGDIYWHRGRCLSYGDGVSYWALADMVRMRAGISEEASATSIADQLHVCVLDLIPDDEERRYVEPRLAQLLGVETRDTWSREDLFAGWRLFFERIADRGPAVLVFEDVQWADDGLLDFIAHLLERGRDKPLYVITLARPELGDRRPGWGSARASTSLFLEPLTDDDMDELLTGMVPGLPAELQSRIRARAEGVPLYAIETVRMLLDRGLVEQVGNRFEPVGRIEELDVPDSLQSLVAARMDGLPPDERTLLQDAAVLGKTFTVDALEALGDRTETQLATQLASLVAREFLGLQADRRSPDHGQYGFLQSLMQKVAYETLAKRDRKAKHLAVAGYLETAWAGDPDEIVEVLASHRLQAYELAPNAEDAAEIRRKACDALAAAGRRAESVAAKSQAFRYYTRAAELAELAEEDPAKQAALFESAGEMAADVGRFDEATDAFDAAVAGFEEAGLLHAAGRVHARTGMSLWYAGHIDEANARMEGAYSALEQDEPDHDVAMLAAQIGRTQFFGGRLDEASGMLDTAIAIAEDLGLPDVLADAFITKGLIADTQRRSAEALALVKGGLDVALEYDVPTSALRGATNMSYLLMNVDRLDEATRYQEMGIELASRLGIASGEWFMLIHRVAVWQLRGEWDRVVSFVHDLPDPADEPGVLAGADVIVGQSLPVFIERGENVDARALADRWITASEDNADSQIRAHAQFVRAVLAAGDGHMEEALARAEAVVRDADKLSLRHPTLRRGWIYGMNAALEIGDIESAERLMKIYEQSPPGQLSPSIRAGVDRYRARLLATAGVSEGVDERYRAAVRAFADVKMPFEEAQVRLDRSGWLAAQGRTEDGATEAARAREIFERLGAKPWIERASALGRAR